MYMNINMRGVELDTRCAICGLLFEDGGHFINCKMVKQRWRALLTLTELRSAKEVIQAILQLPEDKKLTSRSFSGCGGRRETKEIIGSAG
jgi:hypothetical protein